MEKRCWTLVHLIKCVQVLDNLKSFLFKVSILFYFKWFVFSDFAGVPVECRGSSC